MASHIYSYNNGSAGAKALAKALGLKLVKHEGKPLKTTNLINWGASSIERKIDVHPEGVFFNPPACVRGASNKLTAFEAFKANGVSIPPYVTDIGSAELAVLAGNIVVCRTILNGHSGKGIVIAETRDQLVDAKLYTTYIKKKDEYRLHVVGGEVIHQQRKARRKDVPDDKVNWKVRNLDGGFIFQIEGVNVPEEAKKEAISAVEALGLAFGAVDLVLGTNKKWYVLEVNTAPGLEGTTLVKYAEAFKKIIGG